MPRTSAPVRPPVRRRAPARAANSILASVLASVLAGCAGNGAGLDANGRPATPGAGGTPLTADFASIQENVFTPICTVCHAGGAAPQGLRLDSANSYALLVGVPSTEVPSLLRVKPGDPDASYLVQKLEGHAAVGAQMPFGGPPLPAETIAVIRQWIAAGAARAAGSAPSAGAQASAPRLVTAAPAADDLLFAPPARIVLSFDRALDATRLDGTTLRLERVQPDGAAVAVPALIAVPPGNDRGALVTPRATLAPGRYQVSTGGPGSAIAGLAPAPELAPTVLTTFTVEETP
jgi:hypothetical protein